MTSSRPSSWSCGRSRIGSDECLGMAAMRICLDLQGLHSAGLTIRRRALRPRWSNAGDGRFGRAELESDLGERPALQMMQLDRPALAFGKSRERLGHPEQFFVADRALAR